MPTDDDVKFYDEIYTRTPGKWTNVDRDYMAFKLLSQFVDRPLSLLDYGCGNGHTLAFFRNQWQDTSYYGVDISGVARDLTGQRMFGQVWVMNEIPPRRFDVITCMGVAEHFENPVDGLRMLEEHLYPGGYLYMECPNCIAYSEDKTEGYRKTHEGSGQVEWHWRRDTWKQAIIDAGFQIVRNYSGNAPEWQYIWILTTAQTEQEPSA